MNNPTLNKIILVSILLLGVFLRFYGISNQSLWLDELATWEKSAKPDIQSVIEEVRKDVHPPGYQLLIFCIERYAGDSEWHLRLPSSVAGIVAVYLLYLIGSWLYTQKEGLVAAALLASSWAPIYYSQEARSYSLLLCLGLGSIYLGLILLQQIRSGKTPKWYISGSYIAIAACLCYLHYFGVLLVGLEAIWMSVSTLSTKRSFLYVFIIFLGIFILYSPWIPAIFSRLEGGDVGLPPPTIQAVNNYLLFVFGWSHWYLYFIITPLIVLFLAGRAVRFLQQEGRQRYSDLFSSPAFFLFVWFLVPMVITYAVSLIWAPIFTNRNLIISLPAAYLLVARAVTSLPLQKIFKTTVACALVACSLYILIFSLKYYSAPYKQQWREAAAYIVDFEKKTKSQFPVMTFAYNTSHLNYYFQKISGKERVNASLGTKEDILKFAQFIKEKNLSYFWYVVIHRIPEDAFVSYLDNNFSALEYKQFFQADVYLLKRK